MRVTLNPIRTVPLGICLGGGGGGLFLDVVAEQYVVITSLNRDAKSSSMFFSSEVAIDEPAQCVLCLGMGDWSASHLLRLVQPLFRPRLPRRGLGRVNRLTAVSTKGLSLDKALVGCTDAEGYIGGWFGLLLQVGEDVIQSFTEAIDQRMVLLWSPDFVPCSLVRFPRPRQVRLVSHVRISSPWTKDAACGHLPTSSIGGQPRIVSRRRKDGKSEWS